MSRPEVTVAAFLPNLQAGGAERVCVYLANELARRGFGMELVLGQARGEFLADVSSRVGVLDLGCAHALRAVVPLSRYLRQRRPDVLFAHLDHPGVAALLARGLAGVPTRVVPVVHRPQSLAIARSRSAKEHILRAVLRRLYRWADRIVAVSRGVAEDTVRLTGVPADRVRVIYNPVITPSLKALSQEPAGHPWLEPGGSPVILGAGRLTEAKDFATLIRAFAILRRQRRCRLLILGEGERRPELERLARTLGLDGDVALPGYVANPFRLMARSSLFVLSSAWEALGLVLIEALALGVPVVSTDCPVGPREILDGGSLGRLVPVGDAAALAEAMRQALETPRAAVPEAALAAFTLEAAASGYERLIQEVLRDETAHGQ